MKPFFLFTGMLALTTLVVSSCSAPRLAQQNSNDDVYNSVAQAREYKQQVPVREDEYYEGDDYGTSDPFYDMDYSSRINRFSYANPSFMGYYDPYFDGGWYGNYGMGIGIGFGYSPFYGSMWNSPYYGGWGNYYSPFYGYNNWGYNNYYGNGFYAGGLWGGGYWGGGFYTGRTTNAPDYRARPNRGSNSYIGTRGTTSYMQPRTSRGTSTGSTTTSGRPSRGNTNYNPGSRPAATQGTRPSRTETTRPATRPSTESSRPSRTENTRPSRESYTPPPSYNPPSRNEGSSGGSSGGSGGGGGTSRPSRGGR